MIIIVNNKFPRQNISQIVLGHFPTDVLFLPSLPSKMATGLFVVGLGRELKRTNLPEDSSGVTKGDSRWRIRARCL
jgi:hypothetical protein